MTSDAIIEAFVKIKGQDYYISVAKTNDTENLEKLVQDFNKRGDVEELYFYDYLTHRKSQDLFDIYESRHDARQQNEYSIYE